MSNFNIDTNSFAYAWDKTQGFFSENIAKKILNFEKIQNLKINNVLDICFGSANLLQVLSENGKTCVGIETSEEFTNYSKEKYPHLELYTVDNMLNFDNLGKFDLITCNHDMINTLSSINDWENLFQKVYNHLTNGGIFIFDCFSKNKVDNWFETNYSEGSEVDILRQVTFENDSATILNNFYIHLDKENNTNLKVKKVSDSSSKYSFETEEIFSLIKKVKFRYMIYCDANFTPIPQTTESNRIRIIAIKRETII